MQRDDSFETVLGTSPPPTDLESNFPSFGKTPSHSFLRGSYFYGGVRRHSEQEHIEMHAFQRASFGSSSSTTLRRVKSEDEQRRREYVTLEIEESDSEDAENKNWEAEMLAEELDRRNTSIAQKSLTEIESEVKTLQKVMETTDLDELSSSEYRVLETIINASDRKIASISQSNAVSLMESAHSCLPQRQAFSLDNCDGQKNCENLRRRRSTRQSLPSLSSSKSSSEGFPTASGSNDSVFEEESNSIIELNWTKPNEPSRRYQERLSSDISQSSYHGQEKHNVTDEEMEMEMIEEDDDCADSLSIVEITEQTVSEEPIENLTRNLP